MTALDRDAVSTDALLTDLYLDALLAGSALDASADEPDGLAGGATRRIDPAARLAADRLRRDLVRVHPSFRFEERLATRLAEAAAMLRLRVAVGADDRLVAFPGRAGAETADASTAAGDLADGESILGASGCDPASDSGDAQPDSTHRDRSRPLLIGGALTSAALSIAGAAFVAWRLGRPGRAPTPMARAARAVRATSARSGILRGPRPSSAGRDASWPRDPSARGFH